MKLTRSKHKLEVRTSIAPLIDIVLLLIVFCMTVTQLTKAHIEELDLPEAKEGISLEHVEPQRLVINVPRDGRFLIGNQIHTLKELADLLDESTERIRARQTTVVLRCDQDLPWSTVAGLARLCTDRGIYRVRVGVRDPFSVD